jgi:hypothetical protein
LVFRIKPEADMSADALALRREASKSLSPRSWLSFGVGGDETSHSGSVDATSLIGIVASVLCRRA